MVRRSAADPSRYVVVLGARRIAAHRLLGRDEVEVIVRRLDDHQAFLASCVENVQRVELSPREEMDMIGVLIDELGSQEAVARALGKSPTWLSKRKRVLATPLLAAAVERDEISLDHAYDILSRSPDEPTALAQLERVRQGNQNQGVTRGTLTTRGRRVSSESGAISDRNRRGDREQVVIADPALPEVSNRNTIAQETQRDFPSLGASPKPVSDRNQPSPLVQEDGAETEMVDVGSLVTVRLLTEGTPTAPRKAVLDALHADLRRFGENGLQ